MKTNLQSGMIARIAFVLFAAFTLVTSPEALGKETPFSKVVVFGDSLSDTGNFFELSGGSPPLPYANGRFSNGALWIEYFVAGLGMELDQADNYAVGGATTGHLNSNNGFGGRIYPGLQDQIAAFISDAGDSGADPDALYVLWVGANDFFVTLEIGGTPASLIGNGVANTVQAIQTLAIAGARHILVVNIPDLGLTPYAQMSGLGSVVTQLSALYNQALAWALGALESNGVDTIQVDAFSVLQAMVNHPGEFGFENVTAPYLSTGGDADEFCSGISFIPQRGDMRFSVRPRWKRSSTFTHRIMETIPDRRA